MGETFNFSIKKNWKKWTCGRRPMKMIRIFKCFPKSINQRALRRLYKKWKCMTHVRRRFASPLAVNSHVRVEWVANGIGCRYLSTYLLSLSLLISFLLVYLCDLLEFILDFRFRFSSSACRCHLSPGAQPGRITGAENEQSVHARIWESCSRITFCRVRALATQNF